VRASVGYSLAAGKQVEILETTNASGTAAINLSGNSFVQTLRGNAGANMLNGRGGADDMVGFAGNDTYYVDHVDDDVIEASAGGGDSVRASLHYSLDAGTRVEVLETWDAAGTASVNLSANEFRQTLRGNAGANVMNGRGGADDLVGFAGNDTFVFVRGQANGDRVIDFSGNGAAAGDRLQLAGYGPGATFTQIDATHWQVNYNAGASHDVITFANGAAIHASDFFFT
jgi:Ca2+-binding RTX toxin-like protein